MKTSEHELQVICCNYFKSIGLLFFSVPNAGQRSYRTANYFKSEGLTAGVADLVLLFPKGKTVFLEFKAKTGKQKEKQQKFQEEVTKRGFDYYVVKSFEEMVKIIDKTLKSIK